MNVTKILVFCAVVGSWSAARAQDCCGCLPPAPVCQSTATIYVPEIVNEKQTCTVTRYRPETHERVVTVMRNVPETRNVEREYTEYVNETRTRTETYTVMQPEYRDAQVATTYMVPKTEIREATQTVCKTVPVQEQRTVCEQSGHWELRPNNQGCQQCASTYGSGSYGVAPPRTPTYSAPDQAYTLRRDGAVIRPKLPQSTAAIGLGGRLHTAAYGRPILVADRNGNAMQPPALPVLPDEPAAPPAPGGIARPSAAKPLPGGCGGACGSCDTGCTSCAPACTAPCNVPVWVPETVQRQITVTCMKPTYEQVPYQYEKTVMVPEVVTRTVKVREDKPVQMTREVPYTVSVPQKRVRTEQVTDYRAVPEEHREPYTVMMPYQEQQEITVPVCRLVAKTIQMPVVSVCAGCP